MDGQSGGADTSARPSWRNVIGFRDFVFRYRSLVFSAIVLGLAALVFASGMDPQVAPFALVILPKMI